MAEEKKKGHDEHGGEGHGKKGHGKKHGRHGGGGHGGEEHGEGAPEWLISFADNVMLQMGFFVILLALNMGPKGGGEGSEPGSGNADAPKDSFVDWAIAVRAGFNNPVDINSTSANDAPLVKRMKEKMGVADDPGRSGTENRLESVQPSGYSSLGGVVRFVDGSALVAGGERQAVADIAQGIAGLRWMVEVRGHVSPAESVRDERAGWRLSHERAYAVAAALVEEGLEWRQIRLVASGPNQPVTEGRVYDADALRNNQRVEIVVTNEPMPEEP